LSFTKKVQSVPRTTVAMILLIRRFLAVVSACGLAVAIIAYVGSFAGTTMDDMFRWAILLHIGVFVLLLPMYAVDRWFEWETTRRVPTGAFFRVGDFGHAPRCLRPICQTPA
jgi:hypothetical protein